MTPNLPLCLSAVLLSLALGAAPAFAATDCDRLAGDPADIMASGPGVADGRIDAPAAIAACEAAIAAAPGEARPRYQAARALFAAGRDGDGLKRLSEAAEAGYPRAQALLGLLHEKGGHGVAADEASAVALLKAAADRNEPYAAYRLGQRYEKGEGVPQDDREALIYYSKASQRGFRQAREAADRIEAKQKKAGGPFEITGLRYPPWVIAAGFPGELRVAFIGLPNYPVKLVLTAGACPAGQSCPPIVHQVAAADAAGEIVVQDAIDCAGFAAAWKPDYTLTLEDSTGQQTTPKRLRTVCYPDEASQKAAQ